MRSNGVTDDRIRNSLGSYQVIRANIGSVQHQLANFFTFQADADNFVFTGKPIFYGCILKYLKQFDCATATLVLNSVTVFSVLPHV